jgi:hypothetical protein
MNKAVVQICALCWLFLQRESPCLQIMNGMMYHLQLRVVTTSCSENGANEPDCVNQYLSPVKICKVELHRSFTDNSHLDAKVSIP